MTALRQAVLELEEGYYLEQAVELFYSQACLPKDGSESAGRQSAAAMDWHHDQSTDACLAQVVVATADVSQSKTPSLESRKDFLAGDLGQTGHPTATSRSTSSAELGRGRPSFWAASK